MYVMRVGYGAQMYYSISAFSFLRGANIAD